jgi:hypothetical protein
VEVSDALPDFQRNSVPGLRDPRKLTDRTSEFQFGHPDRSEITDQTVSGGAAI